MSNFKEDILKVKAFVFDCDGVLTDGGIITLPSGEALRNYNAKDGFAIAFAVKYGFPVCIISGGEGEAMDVRFKKLKIKHVYLNCRDKVAALHDFAQKEGIELEDMLYMGDDLPDIAPMVACGVATAPADAANDVKPFAKYISNYPGGKGCVRDVIEQVLKAQNRWADLKNETRVASN